MNKKLLILEDDTGLRKVLASDFKDLGFEVFSASAISEVEEISYDYAIVDLNLKNQSGLEILPVLKDRNEKCRILVLTGFGSIATAVEAIKLGAINYILKPASVEQIHSFLLDTNSDYSNNKTIKRTPLSNHEYEYIQFVLNQNKGNISKTAKDLGIYRQSLQRKLKKLP